MVADFRVIVLATVGGYITHVCGSESTREHGESQSQGNQKRHRASQREEMRQRIKIAGRAASQRYRIKAK
jgi:hypothetical protein